MGPKLLRRRQCRWRAAGCRSCGGECGAAYAGFAEQSTRLHLADDAYLELLPGPVIPHRHSRFITSTTAAVAPTATVLVAELVAPGRKHHGGELFHYDLYSSALTISRPDGASCAPRSDVHVFGIGVMRLHPCRQITSLLFGDQAVDQQGAAIITDRG